MRAVVLSIGAEILGGFLTDTNSTFLAQDMSALGIELVGVFQAGDDQASIIRALGRACEDADLIVATGGVGPTEDDLTRESIAEFVGEEVRVDPELLQEVERFFQSRGISMPERNSKQAWLIPSSEALPNPVGTAPGWLVRYGEKIIVSMPGVPREMSRMWQEQVVPRLANRLDSRAVVSHTIKTIGIGESAAEGMIADIIHRGHPVVATYAKNDGVHIRVTASGNDQEEAERLVKATVTEIEEIFGPHVYGSLSTRIGAAIVQHLHRRKLTLSISEHGSAGRIVNLLMEEDVETSPIHCALISPIDRSHSGGDAGEIASERASHVLQTGETDGAFAVVILPEPADRADQVTGRIAFHLVVGNHEFTREQSVTASISEIRRRAALWGCEFLHVSLSQLPA